MKLVAAMFADFADSFVGPARLDESLGAFTVLGSALRRLARIEGADGRCLVVRPPDRDSAARALDVAGLSSQIELVTVDRGPLPRRELFRAARKWHLNSWRCAVMGSTYFDEYVDARAVATILDHCQCEGVLCLDGHQPALDTGIAAGMVRHVRDHADEARLCFTQAPPGLAGILLRRSVIVDLIKEQLPVGVLLSYRPEIPRGDPITRPICLQIEPRVSHVPGRFTGDTRSSLELLRAAFAELGDDCSAVALCEWQQRASRDAGPLPVEVELELTTADPLPNTRLRPRGARVPARELSSPAAVARLSRELAGYDDRLVFLGGHGDPLLHPRFPEVCREIRSAGVFGLGVATSLLDAPASAIEALFSTPVDIVEVRLDADSDQTFRSVHGSERFAELLDQVEWLEGQRRKRNSARPILVPSLTRAAATLADMEPFFDRWIQKCGSVLVHGYNEYCGQLPADSLVGLTPPLRQPCRRLSNRMMLFADGSVPICSQDLDGRTSIGNWQTASLGTLWRSPALAGLREDHRQLNLGARRLCQVCREWFRP